MRRYVTVSVKIPEELKQKLERIGAKPSRLLRTAIEETIREEEVKEIKKQIKELKGAISQIPLKYVVRSIREDRERR